MSIKVVSTADHLPARLSHDKFIVEPSDSMYDTYYVYILGETPGEDLEYPDANYERERARTQILKNAPDMFHLLSDIQTKGLTGENRSRLSKLLEYASEVEIDIPE